MAWSRRTCRAGVLSFFAPATGALSAYESLIAPATGVLPNGFPPPPASDKLLTTGFVQDIRTVARDKFGDDLIAPRHQGRYVLLRRQRQRPHRRRQRGPDVIFGDNGHLSYLVGLLRQRRDRTGRPGHAGPRRERRHAGGLKRAPRNHRRRIRRPHLRGPGQRSRSMPARGRTSCSERPRAHPRRRRRRQPAGARQRPGRRRLPSPGAGPGDVDRLVAWSMASPTSTATATTRSPPASAAT